MVEVPTLGSTYRRSLCLVLPALAVFALVAGLMSLRTETASAAGIQSVTANFNLPALNGQPAAPDKCAFGDSWCAFCSASPSLACMAFTPAHAVGTTAAGATGNSGNNPIPGVTEGGGPGPSPMPMASSGGGY
jgi:hypothetical protein